LPGAANHLPAATHLPIATHSPLQFTYGPLRRTPGIHAAGSRHKRT
jgi:hypothetical protein